MVFKMSREYKILVPLLIQCYDKLNNVQVKKRNTCTIIRVIYCFPSAICHFQIRVNHVANL